MRKDPVNQAVVKITKIIQDQLVAVLGEGGLLQGCSISKAAIHYNLAGQFRTEFGVQGKNGYYVIAVSQPFETPSTLLSEGEAPPDGTVLSISVNGVEP